MNPFFLDRLSLAFGVLLVAAGPAVSWFQLARNGIRQISLADSFSNLETNATVTWLIRLIPYDPAKHPELTVSQLKQLGPKEQLFTFVADYNELRGYTVQKAARMVGASIEEGFHASAIIFPLRTFPLIPATARGVLQVISDIQVNPGTQINDPLAFSDLSPSEIANLKDRNRPSWGWNGYSKYYKDYCTLVQKFRCGKYSTQNFMGSLAEDWHPLGFSKRAPDASSACENPEAVCQIADWDKDARKLLPSFGSRAFLTANLAVSELTNPYLIDFGDPDTQLIPDIGVPDPSD